MNKGQVSTDTPIIFSIFVFQAFVIIMIGFIPIYNVTDIKYNESNATVNLPGVLPDMSFGQKILTNIAILGWGNLIIFAPLEVCFIYIIAKLLRGGG